MSKPIISAQSAPYALLERLLWDACKIGVVFYQEEHPKDVSNVSFELTFISNGSVLIRKELATRTALNRIEFELEQTDKARLTAKHNQFRIRDAASNQTVLAGALTFTNGQSSVDGLATAPDVLVRYVAGQPDPEATVLVVQGPPGDITPELEALLADTLAARDLASQGAATASTKAEQASQSAATASTKAGEASQGAATASTKAEQASQSAATASTKAEQASQGAATATTKAGEASQSAATASQEAAKLTNTKLTPGNVSGSYAVDFSGSDELYLFLTLTGNTTLTLTGLAAGKSIYIRVVQGGAGGYSLAFPGSVRFPAGAAIDWSTAPGATMVFTLVASSATSVDGLYSKY